MSFNAKDILGVTKSVTKEWAKARKAEERGRRSRSDRQYVYSNRVNFTEVADGILPGAYDHASGDGKYTVDRRQLFYAAREEFRERTGREITAKYFSSNILVKYMNRHPNETAHWKVTASSRGTLMIPNAGYKVQIPCGTIPIDNHLRETGLAVDPMDIDVSVPVEWPSLAGGQRIQAVMYIEKEGFDPQLTEARIAEKFDLAIVSCKGQSVVAARKYVDHVCRINGGVPLFVVHDFDKAGFEISQRLTRVSDWSRDNDLVRYEFQNDINVTDFGLRLEDIEKYDLKSEQFEFNGYFASDSICTDAEKEFLQSNRRVELNAFTAPQFIEWIEAKLTEHLGGKRLIPDDDVLEDAYRRALAVAEINTAIEEAHESAIENAEGAEVPKALRRMLRKAMKNSPNAWDKALYDIAKTKVYRVDQK
jgi:hypothetical protein